MATKILSNWEWRDDNDMWTPYHHEDNMLIEKAYQTGQAEFTTTALSFNKEHLSTYVYNFKKLTQKNVDSGRTRKLRRIESSAAEEEEGFMTALGGDYAKAASAITEAKAVDDSPAMKKPRFEFPSLALPPLAVAPLPTPPIEASAVAVLPAPVVSTAAVPVDATSSAPVTSTIPPKPAPSAALISVDPAIVAAQTALGAQSRRHQPYDLGMVAKDPHGKSCFDKMLSREKQLCGEFAVFYHSYSFAALLYEVQAAVAAVLFRFKSEFATLPRLLKKPYGDLPDAAALLALFPKMPSRDHDPRFRAVAISATSSLLANDSEAPPKSVFLAGYSCGDLSFVGVLENLLVSCGVPAEMKSSLAQKIITLSSSHGLDVTQFKGKACTSGRPGHMLQIFLKRNLVDQYVYPAHPFGVLDKKRPILSKYLEGTGPIEGQVRIVTNPSVFMRGSATRMYVYSADPSFHANRPKFQKELTDLLNPIIGAKATRLKAAEGIYGGTLPSWFNPDDYEEQEKKKAGAM